MKHSCGFNDDGIAHNCCEIVDKLKKWKEEEDEAIAMYKGTHFQTKQLSTIELRKLLSKHLEDILNIQKAKV